MRQLTAYASYHDNLGELLIGRVRFCNLDGSPAQVFGIDNATQQVISLGSVVFTNSSGQLTPQVLLENHDYLIFFDKYIGDGTMAEEDSVRGYLYNGKFYSDAAHTTEIQGDANKLYVDVPTDITYRWAGAQYIAVGSDRDSWEEQGSARDYYNTIGVELLSPATRTIDTVTDLHTSIPLGEDEIVLVYGYNSPGDKPPIFYQWDPVSTAQDDGGAVIKVDSVATGRWVFQEPPEKLDVRHFGAFPSSGSVENPEQRYAIQRAGIYAYTHGCGLYFYADQFAAFYDISGLTIHDVDCNPAARLYSTDTKAYIVGIEKVYLGGTSNGYVELVAPTVRTSWANGYVWVVFNPSERLVVDAAIPAGVTHNFSDIIVEMNVYCGQNASFDNCEMVSRGSITGQMVLENMAVKTEWFPDDYDWDNLTMTGCTVLLRNCKDADTYILLKNKIHEADYGDLGEQTVTGATLLAGCVAENAYFVNVTIQGATELHNVTGTVLTNANNFPQLNAVDCWLTFADASDFTLTGLTLNRGAISASNKMFVTAENPTSAAPIIVTIKEAEINCEMEVSYAQLHLERNVVNYDILHIGQMNSIREIIVGNTFNAQLKISNLQKTGLPPAGVVHAVWKDNIGNVSNPLVIDHAKIKTTDSEHSYVYENNTGTFKSSASAHYVITLNVAYNRETAATTDNTISKQDEWLILVSRMYDDGLVAKRGFPPVEIFRVGTDSFAVNVRWTPVPFSGSLQGTDVPGTMIPYEFRMAAEYVDGTYCTFKPITVYGGEPPASGQHKDRSTFIGQCLNVSSIDGISFYADVTISVTS